MTDLDSLKKVIAKVAEAKKEGFKGADWEADYSLNWDDEFLERYGKGKESIARALAALERDDDAELQAALVIGRANFLDLSNFLGIYMMIWMFWLGQVCERFSRLLISDR